MTSKDTSDLHPPRDGTPPPPYDELDDTASTGPGFTFLPPGGGPSPPLPGGPLWQGGQVPYHTYPSQGTTEPPPSYTPVQHPAQGYMVTTTGSVYISSPPAGQTYTSTYVGDADFYVPPPRVAQTHVVITDQPRMTATITVGRAPKPENYLLLSIITCMCFSPLFGLIAIGFSVASSTAYGSGDAPCAKRLGIAALSLCVTGICTSLALLAALLCY